MGKKAKRALRKQLNRLGNAQLVRYAGPPTLTIETEYEGVKYKGILHPVEASDDLTATRWQYD